MLSPVHLKCLESCERDKRTILIWMTKKVTSVLFFLLFSNWIPNCFTKLLTLLLNFQPTKKLDTFRLQCVILGEWFNTSGLTEHREKGSLTDLLWCNGCQQPPNSSPYSKQSFPHEGFGKNYTVSIILLKILIRISRSKIKNYPETKP